MPRVKISMGNGKSDHFDRKLEGILRQAAAVFCAKGFHRASIRDISRATGVSLAGLYYYFSSKEELLYLIQRHAFETILAAARAALERPADPEARLSEFIRLHLEYFVTHPNEMKVLTHEFGSLEDARRREVNALKKSYYRLCFNQVEALKQREKLRELDGRVAALSLFGMMNWIYQWYNPKLDPAAPALADQMAGIFLRGLLGARPGRMNGAAAPSPRQRRRLVGGPRLPFHNDSLRRNDRQAVTAESGPRRRVERGGATEDLRFEDGS